MNIGSINDMLNKTSGKKKKRKEENVVYLLLVLIWVLIPILTINFYDRFNLKRPGTSSFA